MHGASVAKGMKRGGGQWIIFNEGSTSPKAIIVMFLKGISLVSTIDKIAKLFELCEWSNQHEGVRHDLPSSSVQPLIQPSSV